MLRRYRLNSACAIGAEPEAPLVWGQAMINDILAAAVGGGVGGAIGGFLGFSWRKLRKQSSARRSVVSTVLVIGFAVGGARLAADFNGPSFDDQLTQRNPAFAALRRYYPADYQAMVSAVRTQGVHGDAAAIHARMIPFVTRVVGQHVREIDDTTAQATATLTIDELRLLRDKSPESCEPVITGKAPPVDLVTLFPAELQKRDLQNTAALLQQVATHPAPPATALTKDQPTQLVGAAFKKLPPDQQALAEPLITSGGFPKTKPEMVAMCGYYVELFSAASSGPPGTLRGLMASS